MSPLEASPDNEEGQFGIKTLSLTNALRTASEIPILF